MDRSCLVLVELTPEGDSFKAQYPYCVRFSNNPEPEDYYPTIFEAAMSAKEWLRPHMSHATGAEIDVALLDEHGYVMQGYLQEGEETFRMADVIAEGDYSVHELDPGENWLRGADLRSSGCED